MEHFTDDTLHPGMAATGARADEPIRSGLAAGTGTIVAPVDHGHDLNGESLSREVSDADEEEAPPLATPHKSATADDGDFDIPVSDASDSEDGSGSGDDAPDDLIEGSGSESEPERVRHVLTVEHTWGAWRP